MVTIRPATQNDQATITTMVRDAGLNPVNLRWANFLVAEDGGASAGRIVGVGQLRPHADGSRELALLVVDASCRRQGVGSQLVRGLLALQAPPVYLFCEGELEGYYGRFGFQVIRGAALPPPLARLYRAGRLATRVGAWLHGHDAHLVAMCLSFRTAGEESLP